MTEFKLISDYEPKGDQPQAIKHLIKEFQNDKAFQTLLGVTGSGKTFTMANIIQVLQRPTLVISHNKTLAAQLFSEFRDFFPDNAVEYFVSYYDYYQPEAYIPQRDIYIEKDASINDELDRLRLRATSSLMHRRDVVIVASVSCIYGLGSPEDYEHMLLHMSKSQEITRDEILHRLVDIQYNRNDTAFGRGQFRVRGDTIEIYPAYDEKAYSVEMFGDELERISMIDPLTGEVLQELSELNIYPAKHFVMPEGKVERALADIEDELEERLAFLRSRGKLLEAQRLEARTRYDMEMLTEIGYCPGVENYSRHLSGRAPGEPPFTLMDYFPDDYLVIIDESHVTVPQIRGMFNGDRSRKTTLVEHGFRLPSALDNRPLRFDEWEAKVKLGLFVSATPEVYEMKKSGGEVVEQMIRPTGLIDPTVHVRPARGQVKDLLKEIHKRVKMGDRILVTTLTKRLAEDLSEFIRQEGLRGKYLHSEIDTIERVAILRDLRLGKFDVLVGVNLLREGLDLPEVSLVAILDADKEGFLRSETSLIQTMGRTARNVNAEVILYAEKVTRSMQRAIDETHRRRDIQMKYNEQHNITPETIRKAIRAGIEEEIAGRKVARDMIHEDEDIYITQEFIRELEQEMYEAAERLDFEHAADIRDRIATLKSTKEYKKELSEQKEQEKLISRGKKRHRSKKRGYTA